jgi:hypothetical protein
MSNPGVAFPDPCRTFAAPRRQVRARHLGREAQVLETSKHAAGRSGPAERIRPPHPGNKGTSPCPARRGGPTRPPEGGVLEVPPKQGGQIADALASPQAYAVMCFGVATAEFCSRSGTAHVQPHAQSSYPWLPTGRKRNTCQKRHCSCYENQTASGSRTGSSAPLEQVRCRRHGFDRNQTSPSAVAPFNGSPPAQFALLVWHKIASSAFKT